MSTGKKLFSFPFASSGTGFFPLSFQPDKTITGKVYFYVLPLSCMNAKVDCLPPPTRKKDTKENILSKQENYILHTKYYFMLKFG